LNTKDIEQLIAILEASSIAEIEYSTWGKKIRVSRQNGSTGVSSPGVNTFPATAPIAPEVADEVEDVAKPAKGVAIKSPMVGTFYRSPSPDSEFFVKVGDHVGKGDTLCIIEAMKIMNEVEAEMSGVILDIKVDNAQPVEYGQTLFLIEP